MVQHRCSIRKTSSTEHHLLQVGTVFMQHSVSVAHSVLSKQHGNTRIQAMQHTNWKLRAQRIGGVQGGSTPLGGTLRGH